MHCARLRKSNTRHKAHPFGCVIDGDEQIQVPAPAEDGERSFSFGCCQGFLRTPALLTPRPQEPVGR
jgi:hypothetical protein